MRLDEAQERELIESMEQLARWARHIFLRFETEGFNPVEALALTRTWLKTVSGGGATGGDE